MGWATAQFECGSEMALVQPVIRRNGPDSNGILHLDRELAFEQISDSPWSHGRTVLLPHAPSGDGCNTRSEKDRQLSEGRNQNQAGIELGGICIMALLALTVPEGVKPLFMYKDLGADHLHSVHAMPSLFEWLMVFTAQIGYFYTFNYDMEDESIIE